MTLLCRYKLMLHLKLHVAPFSLGNAKEDLPDIVEHEKEQEPGMSSAGGSFGFTVTGQGLETSTASSASIEIHQV